MARRNNPQDTIKVRDLTPSKGVKVGKPSKLAMTSSMRMKTGSFPGYGGGFGTVTGSGGNFYSPELSTDFLELPQSRDELRNYLKFFYKYEPFVGQALDLSVELPLSKIRLKIPKAKNRALAERSLRFCEKWANNVKLLQRLMEILHNLNLLGEVPVYCVDRTPEMPREIREFANRIVEEDGTLTERWEEHKDADDREVAWLNKNYKGWTSVMCLPPEQVRVQSFPFTREKLVEVVPDTKTKAIIEQAKQGDPQAERVVNSMPPEFVEAFGQAQTLPLNTDPYAGSFVYVLARDPSGYEPNGQPILERVLRTLIFRDKVRQSLTSIASRHMTPYRLIYAEDMNDDQTEQLREQVDLALQDPDYSIITNYQVNWEEMGAEQRLPDWSWVYELTDKQMYAGLGMTESLLSGESSYSGDRIHLEVLNTRFMLIRELLQDLVETYFFKPMCARMGFVETDEDGEDMVIFPKLSFTRLALRDTAETYDAMFNLYQKGSLDIDTIYDLLNIDPVSASEKIKHDIFTPNDPIFNEFLRSLYSTAGQTFMDGAPGAAERIATSLGLKYKKPNDATDRFGGSPDAAPAG